MSAALIPTLEQLRVLVDRAERGRLTGAEARVLRAGIEALAAQIPREAELFALRRPNSPGWLPEPDPALRGRQNQNHEPESRPSCPTDRP